MPDLAQLDTTLCQDGHSHLAAFRSAPSKVNYDHDHKHASKLQRSDTSAAQHGFVLPTQNMSKSHARRRAM